MTDDLISRSALIAEYCDGCDYPAKGLCDNDVCGFALLVKEAPAVDAEPVRHGEWRFCKVEHLVYAECSECYAVHGAASAALWDYCPNCGAKMDKED